MEASGLQKSMKMAMIKCTKESEDEQTTRKKVNWFVFLPDDILLDIFKRVPDDFLRYKAKYVSRQWFNIITHNILRNHASLILGSYNVIKTTRYVNIREEQEGLEVEEQYLDHIPRIGRIRSWCNEFLLISIYNKEESLYVYNLITKEGSYLPQCKASCGLEHRYGTCRVALSYDGFKGIYKVVHLVMGSPIQCEILVLIERDIGSRVSSKWKNIEVPYKNVGPFCLHEPVSVQGRYLHWIIGFPLYLLSMDTVKEQIFQVSLPAYRCGSLFEMGGFLALFHRLVSCDKAEIWILKNIQRMKWEKLQSVTLQSWCIRMHPLGTWDLYPVCAVISKRYVILENISSKGLLSYDLKYGIVKELDIQPGDRFVVHSSAPSFK